MDTLRGEHGQISMRIKRFCNLIVLVSLCLSACAATPQATATLNPVTPLPAFTLTRPPTTTHTPTLTHTPTPFSTPTPTASATPTSLPPKVVLISIDGLRPDAFFQTSAPNLLALAQSGAYTWQAQTILPSVTLPAHASMLCGCPVETHGLTWNDYRPNQGVIQVPTIFSVAHAAGLRTVMVVGKEKLAHFNTPGDVDSYTFARAGDQDVADQAMAQVEAGFDLMFVHFPNMDYFGHLLGWMSDRYLSALTQTDEAVGRLLAALPPQTTIIVTSDHGGHGLTHGSDLPEDLTIPWMIAGPNVAANHEITAPIITTDTGATVLYVLGLGQPETMTGAPVYEAFGSTD